MNEQQQMEAFKALFFKCLRMRGEDDFLVIYDESLDPFLEAFERTLESESVSSTLVYLPQTLQRLLMKQSKSRGSQDKIDLPSSIVAAIAASTAMINLLDSTPYNAPVRKAINHTPRPNNCRLATIPGISTRILEVIIESPIEEILSACEEMAWMLGESSRAEIKTFDSEGREYSLKLELGGWENEPIMSPGVLLPGSWGNVPPGETFCSPAPETVNGFVCVNGSVPGHVLRNGQEVVLNFSKGKLISWTTPTKNLQSPALGFFDQQRTIAVSNEDDNWNTFAELGIGLNPQIVELTGNPLFDEKAIRTLHVAIGDNSVFGDDVSSFIHEDLVTRCPSLLLDGVLVMNEGVIDSRQIQKLRTERSTPNAGIKVKDALIYLREGRIGYHNGEFMRRLTKAERINYVRMAQEDVNSSLADLYETLKAHGIANLAAFLKNHADFSGHPTEHLLAFLYHYRVIDLVPSQRHRSP
jgi:hypothetical protein